ncbi:macro domain-containing protein [Marinobacter salicampi]|uniref:macro domain-containing protein n=1 Tax=Marinobacter salicampi TaxID=435907 RepID=UPI00140AB1C3|nr:macro domain-containing protein [Marinobacter salicampi]
MSQRQIHGVTIECVQGDITQQPDMAAIVNAANAELRTGGGVAGAIHRAAGPGLEDECHSLAPIRPGQAVITGGQNLPNKFVIHCLGPVYGVDEPADERLAACYRNAIALAEEHGIRSLAFPAISTGAFGYPMEAAARVAFSTLLNLIGQGTSVAHIRFVLASEGDRSVHDLALGALADPDV